MDPVKIIRLKESILADNDADAEELRRQTKDAGLCYVNLMSSPGSGKTSTILALIEELKKRGAVAAPASTAVGQTGTSAADSRDAASEQPESPLSIGVMEADIDSDVDAQTIQDKAGVPAVQLHTGGMCHLDADMSRQSLNMEILSIPEGDDKPLKYPLVFTKCDAVIINKIDALPVFNFDIRKCTSWIRERSASAEIFPVSAKTGEGIDKLADWLEEKVRGRISAR